MKEKSKRTRSQVGKYSRRKGGQYEGKISKMLSKWWFGEEGILRKTPRSGGWSNKFPFDITIENDFPFGTSGKKVEGWHFESLIKSRKNIFYTWLDEQYSSLERLEDWDKDVVGEIIPLLIFSKNHDADYLMIAWNDYTRIAEGHPDIPRLTWTCEKRENYPANKFVIFLLKEFLEEFDPKNIKFLWEGK